MYWLKTLDVATSQSYLDAALPGSSPPLYAITRRQKIRRYQAVRSHFPSNLRLANQLFSKTEACCEVREVREVREVKVRLACFVSVRRPFVFNVKPTPPLSASQLLSYSICDEIGS